MAEFNPSGESPIEQDDVESASPRRGASAQFVIDSRPGDAAALREAMNPANQSLGEALRLTFRVLQVVIVVLVVMFLFSGFKTVQEGSTGVKTLFGDIQGEPGDEALMPGPVLFWPYPVGETITFPVKRGVDLGTTFWPRLKDPTKKIDEIVENVSSGDGIVPGSDGSLLTREGDLFHMKVTAEFLVRDPRKLVTAFNPENMEQLVRAAIRRGVVQTAAALTLSELADIPQEPIELIKAKAQETLNALNCGIEITQVTIPERSAPLAIRKQYSEVQQAREDRKTTVRQAGLDAEKRLNEMAGPRHDEFTSLISTYEEAIDLEDSESATVALEEIGKAFEADDTAGTVAQVINMARSYRTSIQSTLGGDTDRFLSLLPSYKENPGLVVSQLWFEAYRGIMTSKDTEVLNVPFGSGPVTITVPTSREIWEMRRRTDLDMRRLQGEYSGSQNPNTLRGVDIPIGGPGRLGNRDMTSPQANPQSK